MDELLNEFLTETAESLEAINVALVSFESDPNDRATLDSIFRLVHTIKGTCSFLELPRLEAVAHAAETLLGRFRDGDVAVTADAVTLVLEAIDCIKAILGRLERDHREPDGDDTALIARLEAAAERRATLAGADLADEALQTDYEDASSDALAPAASSAQPSAAPAAGDGAEDAGARREASSQTIRVNVDVLENLMTMVSELVLTRNQLLQMVRRSEQSEFKAPLQRLSNITAELQDGVMQTRMQPVGNAWRKLPRVVRDIANDLGKKINLIMEGEDTELDRHVLDLIKDPLTHMVRNSCDHGIEDPQTRRARGKPEAGVLRLSAYHEGGHIIIDISDDGAGLNVERIRRKALDVGLITPDEAAQFTEGQIQRLIFAAGFSTAAKVTNISGRGVGMDVVRDHIEQIGGAIDVHSVEGRGATFTIKIPLTLAIISALIVAVAGHRFAIPQLSVLELVRVGGRSQHRVDVINATQVLRLRDRLLPLVDLGQILNLRGPGERDAHGFVVVMRVGGQRFGVVVDDVFDTEEIVVKPLASALRGLVQFSGNTILGDGSVIMIMDPNGLAHAVSQGHTDAEHAETAEETRAERARTTRSMLIFRAGSSEPKAAPLSLITRLEDVPVEKIERGAGGLLVQYRGRLMPLALADPAVQLHAAGTQPILVFTDRDRAAGLVVDEILDVVDEAVDVEIAGDRPGVAGTAVLRGHATEIIDVGHYLTQARPDWFATASAARADANRRLLLVDDSAFYRNIMEPILTAAGYDVTGVEAAEDAWRLYDAGQDYDVIVADLSRADGEGVTFAEKLERVARWADVPRIALSSNATRALSPDARAAFAQLIPKTERGSVVEALDTVFTASGEAA